MNDQPVRRYARDVERGILGHKVARVVCGDCGNRELAHARRSAAGVVRLVIPEPDGRTRDQLVGRKARTGRPVEPTVVVVDLADVPLDVPTRLTCRKHGARVVDTRALADAARDAKATSRPRVAVATPAP